MKSLQRHSTIFLRVSITMVILITISFLSFIYLGAKNQKAAAQYRSTLQIINSAISELYQFEAAGESPNDSPLQKETLQELRSSIEHSIYHKRLSESVLSQGWPDISGDTAREQIDSLGGMARTLGAEYQKTTRNILYWSVFNVFAFFILTVFTMIWVFKYRKAIISFINSINRGIDGLQNLIRYRKTAPGAKPQWAEEETFLEAVEHVRNELESDRELSEMNIHGSLEEFLPRLKKLVKRNIPCDRLALAFLNPFDKVIAESAVTELNSLHLEPGFIESLENTSLGKIIDSGQVRIINDLETHYDRVHKSAATKLLLKEGIRSNLTAPLIINGKTIGFLFISSTTKNIYTDHHILHAMQLINPLRQNLYYQYLIQQVISETSKSFVTLMAKKDNETSLHITRMSLYGYTIAKKLFEREDGISPRFMREILWFSPLHDIGKIGIPDNILLKPGALTNEEFDVMKSHVTIGESVVNSMSDSLYSTANIQPLKTAIDLISSHHEKWDGSGYPRGLKGRDIPLAGRIVAIADVFDALTSRRPYKKAFSIVEALDIMQKNVGTHFDPWVYSAFLSAQPEIKRIHSEYKEI